MSQTTSFQSWHNVTVSHLVWSPRSVSAAAATAARGMVSFWGGADRQP